MLALKRQTEKASASSGHKASLKPLLFPFGVKINQFEQFYQAIAQAQAPTTVLKQAMQHVRKQPRWAHPFYWAAFQISGLGVNLPK